MVENEDYLLCRSILEEHAKTFYFASKNLPENKKRGFWAVYAFCRKTDDIIDEGTENIDERRKKLNNWKESLLRAHNGTTSQNGIIRAFVHTMNMYQIPLSLPLKLIKGVETDSYKVKIESFSKLKEYCFSVASVVGLMLLYVMESNLKKASKYAISLGIAMQLTNILRDIAEDARMGRFYLPKTELQSFGLDHSDLRAALSGDKMIRFRRFLKFQIKRARNYYRKAMGGIKYLPKELQMTILMASRLYSKILDKIEKNNYDISRRVFVPFHEKVLDYIMMLIFSKLPMRQLSQQPG